MFDWYKWDVIKKLEKSKKAIIAIGDSFTQGAGACSESIWEKNNWDISKIKNHDINYKISCYNNSFVHKLCDDYLGDFVPINMGMEGRGNRAAVKELYLHPELELQNINTKIVIFFMTGYERFDFVCKDFFEHLHFRSVWPHENKDVADSELWKNYGEFVFSDRTATIELLLSIAELKTWCELNNAFLIIGSAFRPEYNFNTFYENIRFSSDDPNNYISKNNDYITRLVNLIDWKNYFKPGGYSCISDYLCGLEEREDLISKVGSHKYYEYAYTLEKMSPKGYITNCAHPSYLGHEKLAEELYKHISKNNENIKKITNIHGKKISTNLI